MIGERIAGRYELVARLGSGGSSSVWVARDRRTGDDVALKLLDVDRLDGASAAAARFEREARLLGGIASPHIVRLLDHGAYRGRPYLVMPLLDAEDLRTILRRRGPLPPREAIGIAAQVADGLAAAHAHRVVHRDLKPANVLLDPSGRVTLIDFGIARSLLDPGITAPGRVLGTGEYVSPEQAVGDALDARSDLYALGVLLFELVAGHAPFRGQGFADVAAKHVRSPAPSLAAAAPGTPRALVTLVSQLLAKRADERPRDAASVRERLDAIARGLDGDEASTGDGEVDLAPARPLVGVAAAAGAGPQWSAGGGDDDPGLAPWEDPTPNDLGPLPDPEPAVARRAAQPPPASSRRGGGPPVLPASAATPFLDDAGPDERRPSARRNSGGLRWGALLGLVVALLAGAFVLRPLLAADGKDDGDGATTATASGDEGAASGAASAEAAGDATTEAAAGAASTAAEPSLRPLPPATATSFDPNGTDGSENEDEALYAIDGDPTTTWSTETYSGLTDLTGFKGGVGLSLDFGSVVQARRVEIATPRAGWTVSVYASVDEEAPTSLDGWRALVPTRTTTGTTRLALPRGTEARHLLLWVTQLVPTADDANLAQASIAEIKVLG